MNRWCRRAVVAIMTLTLSSCAVSPALSPEDTEALATLAEVSGPTSGVDAADITRTECWLPSEHLVVDEGVSATTWRVLCRAHYVDDTGDRYQDATCVGDFAASPMIDHCYRWAYYTGMPAFEDFPAVEAE